jgi:hypothetical protein
MIEKKLTLGKIVVEEAKEEADFRHRAAPGAQQLDGGKVICDWH